MSHLTFYAHHLLTRDSKQLLLTHAFIFAVSSIKTSTHLQQQTFPQPRQHNNPLIPFIPQIPTYQRHYTVANLTPTLTLTLVALIPPTLTFVALIALIALVFLSKPLNTVAKNYLHLQKLNQHAESKPAWW